MANKFGLGNLKNEVPTLSITKFKPYFVDQTGDTLQGDIDMNNFKITNLRFPQQKKDAINKGYLIQTNKSLHQKITVLDKDSKNQLENHQKLLDSHHKKLESYQQQLTNIVDKTQLDRINLLISQLDEKITKQKSDIKQLIANIKPGISEDKLKQELANLETKLNDDNELTEIKTFIQQQLVVDKSQLEDLNLLISQLDDKITNVKQLIANIKPGISENKLKQELTNLETKLNDDSKLTEIKTYVRQQLVNVVDKTQLQNLTSLISKLDDRITKQKLDLKQLIDNIKPGITEEKLKQELSKLETNNNNELAEIKTYIQQQLVSVADKTQLQNLNLLITQLDDKITKQKSNVKQLIANIKPGISEDKLKQELSDLEAKLNDNNELTEIKTYIEQQLANVVDKAELERLNSSMSQLDKKIESIDIKSEKVFQEINKKFLPEETYFSLPFNDGILEKYGFVVKYKGRLIEPSKFKAVFERSNFAKFELNSAGNFVMSITILFPFKLKIKSVIKNEDLKRIPNQNYIFYSSKL